jgi:hypothetical protein
MRAANRIILVYSIRTNVYLILFKSPRHTNDNLLRHQFTPCSSWPCRPAGFRNGQSQEMTMAHNSPGFVSESSRVQPTLPSSNVTLTWVMKWILEKSGQDFRIDSGISTYVPRTDQPSSDQALLLHVRFSSWVFLVIFVTAGSSPNPWENGQFCRDLVSLAGSEQY